MVASGHSATAKRASGALDEREVLGEGEVLARVLGELGRLGAGTWVGEAAVGAWVSRWWRAATAAAAAAAGAGAGAADAR